MSPGSDGDFTPTAYAKFGSMGMAGNPAYQAYLSKQLADRVEDDNFFDAFEYAIDQRFASMVDSA